ncbi:ThuA domain-containing protein [Streptomyces sp. NBC_01304]|uniref:ThuA domain-containing protein n=1 Tax=Streptomyces sp. NBC_01304 TaxID=2903818 RepID=UPI002E0F845E|nr:ThuA domain-containing protein [Streptomyces sp. NBC_01304]
MRNSLRQLRRAAGAFVLAAALSVPVAEARAADPYQVLVFSKTAGFRHDSIPAGIDAVRTLGAVHGFTVTATEDAGAFTPESLAGYEAVVFLNTTGDVLDDNQQSALQSYVDGGGGYVGVHAAADTEYDWPYYGDLAGARFKSHPAIQQATLKNEDRTHPATSHLGETWTRTDEWYNYRANPRLNVRVLQSLDETTYSGGDMGDHPITWCHAQGSGRSFYTGLGHTAESYADNDFRTLLLGGIQYAAGAVSADCTPRRGGTEEGSPDVHLFYYPWYGSPATSGSWRHWAQGGHTPPEDIGADLYPALGPYDSGDHEGAVAQHMKWVARSGAGVLVYSWWGRGGYEDTLAKGVLDAAEREGIKVAWHIEPYQGRTAQSVADDVTYLNERYGSHPAFYRSAAHGNKPAFYVFESLKITDWAPLDQVTGSNIVLAQTTDTTKIAHFSGLYTYDGIAGATAPGWKQAGDYARAHDLIWAPSVAPGYIDDRAVPGNTTPTLGRDNGAAYDKQWSNALAPAIGGSPTWVSVTSFNEWHEGSSIEPADSTPPAGHDYQTFDGAYGTTGEAAETAYLDRTAYWVKRFEEGAVD